MRLEIGAGAAAGCAGGVLWSSAILAAISPRRAAFTSPLPAPARSAEPAASARLCPPPPAQPGSVWSCCPRRPARSSSELFLAPSYQRPYPVPLDRVSSPQCIAAFCLLAVSTSDWTPFGPVQFRSISGSLAPHSLCFSLPQFPLLGLLCPLP